MEPDMGATPAPAANPADTMAAAFNNAAHAVIDGEGDAATKATQIKEILKELEKMLAKLTGKADAEAGGGEEKPAEEKKETPESKQTLESLQEELRVLKAKDEVRALCEARGVKPEAIYVEAAVALPADKRKAFVDALPLAPTGVKPRSTSPVALVESKSGAPKNTDEFLAAVCRR